MHNVFASRKRLVRHSILGIAPRVPRKRVSMTLGAEDPARALDGLAMIEDYAKPASGSIGGGVHYGTLCGEGFWIGFTKKQLGVGYFTD